MFAFILRRLLQSLIVMLAVAFIAFLMFRFVGDPVEGMMGVDARLSDREALRDRLGLNDPFYMQFWTFVKNAVQGEFGISYRLQQPVTQLILSRLPATLELAVVSASLALIVGVTLGVFTAIHGRLPPSTRETLLALGAVLGAGVAFHLLGGGSLLWTLGGGAAVFVSTAFWAKRFFSQAIMAVSLVGVSLPTFLIGIGLIFVFAVEMKLLPSFGRGQTVQVWSGWSTGFLTKSGLLSLILPAVTLSLFQMTLIMRLVRAEMQEVLRSDYIRFARARGLPESKINFRHALKNTLVPVITITGLQLGSIIAFAIITETVFNWPGVGSLFVNSVQAVDVPVMAAYLLFVALVFVVINLIVDLLYYLVDPRLRVDGRAGRT
ncbi:ABC transporter permease [Neomegalonema sp.]|uniref:ABC transporter permease n=1 Tax=Neomegalonema sp. TaxID=2039713 RepID=UPI002627B0C4|nr:ABC transporter permease [Neomegalonema sp.]MDD2868702.1 ABC transporter permease [Neomegalonema sp.]